MSTHMYGKDVYVQDADKVRAAVEAQVIRAFHSKGVGQKMAYLDKVSDHRPKYLIPSICDAILSAKGDTIGELAQFVKQIGINQDHAIKVFKTLLACQSQPLAKKHLLGALAANKELNLTARLPKSLLKNPGAAELLQELGVAPEKKPGAQQSQPVVIPRGMPKPLGAPKTTAKKKSGKAKIIVGATEGKLPEERGSGSTPIAEQEDRWNNRLIVRANPRVPRSSARGVDGAVLAPKTKELTVPIQVVEIIVKKEVPEAATIADKQKTAVAAIQEEPPVPPEETKPRDATAPVQPSPAAEAPQALPQDGAEKEKVLLATARKQAKSNKRTPPPSPLAEDLASSSTVSQANAVEPVGKSPAEEYQSAFGPLRQGILFAITNPELGKSFVEGLAARGKAEDVLPLFECLVHDGVADEVRQKIRAQIASYGGNAIGYLKTAAQRAASGPAHLRSQNVDIACSLADSIVPGSGQTIREAIPVRLKPASEKAPQSTPSARAKIIG